MKCHTNSTHFPLRSIWQTQCNGNCMKFPWHFPSLFWILKFIIFWMWSFSCNISKLPKYQCNLMKYPWLLWLAQHVLMYQKDQTGPNICPFSTIFNSKDSLWSDIFQSDNSFRDLHYLTKIWLSGFGVIKDSIWPKNLSIQHNFQFKWYLMKWHFLIQRLLFYFFPNFVSTVLMLNMFSKWPTNVFNQLNY